MPKKAKACSAAVRACNNSQRASIAHVCLVRGLPSLAWPLQPQLPSRGVGLPAKKALGFVTAIAANTGNGHGIAIGFAALLGRNHVRPQWCSPLSPGGAKRQVVSGAGENTVVHGSANITARRRIFHFRFKLCKR